jgi:hypothetical protein
MENLIFLLATSLVLRISANSRKTFNKYLIGDTGCSVYTFPKHNKFESVLTLSGDRMYFHDYTEDDVTYGIICVHLQEPYSLAEAEELLQRYMHKLKEPLYILHETGIRNAFDYNSATSVSLENYWQDIDHVDWKVKGYTNGKVISVLYVKNIGQADIPKQEFFLDSFHFKASL